MSSQGAIRRVLIEGLWGHARLEARFDRHVNILYGLNGTGKTSLLRALAGALTYDDSPLADLAFDRICVDFVGLDEQTHQVSVSRKGDEFSRHVDDEPLPGLEEDRRASRMAARLTRARARRLRETGPLAQLIGVTWLPVSRSPLSDTAGSQTRLDRRLAGLQDELRFYMQRLRITAQKVWESDFRNQVAELMLYDPELDDEMSAPTVDTRTARDDFREAFTKIGLYSEEIAQKTDRHFAKLEEYNKIMGRVRAGVPIAEIAESFDLANLLTLGSITRRTARVIEFIEDAAAISQQHLALMDQFVRTMNDFMTSKEWVADYERTQIRVSHRSSEQPLRIEYLSSGERQLLVLALSVLLQKRDPGVLLCDEPELSLHVEWQAKLLEALRDLNPNAQLIVATHSPDIVGPFRDRLIDMEDIVDVSS